MLIHDSGFLHLNKGYPFERDEQSDPAEQRRADDDPDFDNNEEWSDARIHVRPRKTGPEKARAWKKKAKESA